MKKLIFSLAALLTTALAGNAQFMDRMNELGIFNHLGVGVHAATTGFGFEVSTPITQWCQMRVGASFMPGIKFNTNQTANLTLQDPATGYQTNHSTDVDIEASLARSQGSLIFNAYPFGSLNSLFVAVGAYFGGANIIKVSGHTDDVDANNWLEGKSYIEIGDYHLPIDKEGWARGALRANSFRPYLGLGYGRPVPGKRVNFMVELGVQFMGHMKVYDTLNEEVPLSELTDSDDDWQKWMNKLTVYPVLKFTLNGRIL